jgi:8-oxo-dGTP pyrophosphatase MutT (NUDIX family)
VDLEVPGGVMDATDASPVETAMRELREETGYEGRDPRLLGSIAPNPAILNNWCHTVLIEDCRPTTTLDLDPGEDLATRLVPAGDLARLVREGRLPHALVAVAVLHYELWRQEQAGLARKDPTP